MAELENGNIIMELAEVWTLWVLSNFHWFNCEFRRL